MVRGGGVSTGVVRSSIGQENWGRETERMMQLQVYWKRQGNMMGKVRREEDGTVREKIQVQWPRKEHDIRGGKEGRS